MSSLTELNKLKISYTVLGAKSSQRFQRETIKRATCTDLMCHCNVDKQGNFNFYWIYKNKSTNQVTKHRLFTINKNNKLEINYDKIEKYKESWLYWLISYGSIIMESEAPKYFHNTLFELYSNKNPTIIGLYFVNYNK